MAEELRRIGIRPGDKVGIIGNGFFAYWARLARVRLVAELPFTSIPAFAAADARTREQVLHAFRRAGARLIVGTGFEGDPGPGWRPVPRTGDYLYPLDRHEDGSRRE